MKDRLTWMSAAGVSRDRVLIGITQPCQGEFNHGKNAITDLTAELLLLFGACSTASKPVVEADLTDGAIIQFIDKISDGELLGG